MLKEVEADVKPEVETDNKPEVEADVKPEVEADVKPEVEPVHKEEESEIKLVIDDNVDNTIIYEITVDIPDDIVNFDIKNFKIPYCVTTEDISFFLKSEPVNTSIEHRAHVNINKIMLYSLFIFFYIPIEPSLPIGNSRPRLNSNNFPTSDTVSHN